MGDEQPGGAGDEQVGSLADEAAKLFGALGGWAREQGGGGVAAAAADAVRHVDEHVATGGAECTWCPVCRTVHAIRQTSPEVRDQLVVAATALLQAGAGLLTSLQAGADGHTTAPPVERIDLDDDPDDDPADPGAVT